MTERTRIAATVLLFALGAAGCDGPLASPWAPSSVSQATPQAAPSPFANLPGYSLSVSSDTVSPGGELRVSWTAPSGGGLDWVGLFAVGAAPCDHGWWEYTMGASSGTLTLQAPSRTGSYEFRYLPDDGCVEAARSQVVVVGAGS